MSKLNSLFEATRGLDKKDTSNLTIGCVHMVWTHLTQLSDVSKNSSWREKLVLELGRLNHTLRTYMRIFNLLNRTRRIVIFVALFLI